MQTLREKSENKTKKRIDYEPLIIYTKFFDNNINQSEDINKKDVKKMLFERCIFGCGRVRLGSGHSGSECVIVAQSGS